MSEIELSLLALIWPFIMGKVINAFLSTPIPPEVWHYTNLAGFEGILSSGRVWATEAHHTTDKTEFVHAREIAVNFLERWRPENVDMAWARQSAQAIIVHAFDDGPLASSKSEIFVVSFSAADDLKSQWIEYANAGRGVSLSFDLRHIRPPSEIESAATFAPCLYKTDEKERILEDALSDWVKTASDLHEKTGSKKWMAERLRDWQMIGRIYGSPFDKAGFLENNKNTFRELLQKSLARTSFDLLRIASHCKHHAFHQETEWRLALPHLKAKPMRDNEVLRRGPNREIPYIAHNLFSNKLPLVRVKAGWMCESLEQIDALLTRYGYHVPVEHSAIPIRPAG